MIELNDIKKEYPIFTGASKQGLQKALRLRGCTPIKKGNEFWYSKNEIETGLMNKPYRNKHFRPEDGIRFFDCVRYEECLNKAARIDSGLDCAECSFYFTKT